MSEVKLGISLMMAKKKTWFSLIKRLFISEPQSRLEKGKRRRWAFRLLKLKQLSWQKAEDSISDVPEIVHSQHDDIQSSSSAQTNGHREHTLSQDLAATKIQAAFRGYLARRALGALKGVVKLQALIRGWAVRQQAINTLKCLQSLVNIQTQVFSNKTIRINHTLHCQDYKSQDFREKDIKVDLNSQKRWDDSTLTKEEIKALFLTKRDASIKRERSKEYYLNHRRSAETERDKVYGRRRYWLEQWVDAQLAKSGGNGNGNPRNTDEVGGKRQKQHQAEMAESPPTCMPRRPYHHHRKQRSIGEWDEHSFVGSPSTPAYMAFTESAKARSRSMSSPRLRPLSFDVSSEITSPYKHKLSPVSSINSELTSSSWVGNHVNSSQRSPRLKGPIKSTMSTKELRLRGIYHQY
ncbi:hypothetical protein ACS0TY_020480 [Phlomoides rotata]